MCVISRFPCCSCALQVISAVGSLWSENDVIRRHTRVNMTSLHHDDSIEIITTPHTSSSHSREPIIAIVTSTSSTLDDMVVRPGHAIDIGMTLISAATTVVRPIDSGRLPVTLTSRYFRRKCKTSLSAKDSIKEKRIKKAVMIIATLMIMASMILVGVSLSMSQHIDEMGTNSFRIMWKCDAINSNEVVKYVSTDLYDVDT